MIYLKINGKSNHYFDNINMDFEIYNNRNTYLSILLYFIVFFIFPFIFLHKIKSYIYKLDDKILQHIYINIYFFLSVIYILMLFYEIESINLNIILLFVSLFLSFFLYFIQKDINNEKQNLNNHLFTIYFSIIIIILNSLYLIKYIMQLILLLILVFIEFIYMFIHGEYSDQLLKHLFISILFIFINDIMFYFLNQIGNIISIFLIILINKKFKIINI